MRLLLTLIAAFCALTGTAQALTAKDREAIAAVEGRIVPRDGGAQPAVRTLATRMTELGTPGVSIAFIENGRVSWARAYGVADTVERRPVTPETLFQAASMSKAVAAAGALRLVDQGRLDLDGDINARLKSWKVPDSPFTAERKVTLRELLSHTAGLTVSGFPGYVAGKPFPDTVQILNGTPPANTPAVRSWEAPGAYAYSGGGFTVAQLAMVDTGGRPFPQLMETLVLRPAGMRRSTFVQPLPPGLLPKAASGHNAKSVVIPGGRNVYPEYAAAGLWTTPSDYGRFLIAVQNSQAGRRGALLSRAAAHAMLTPVDGNYGLGVGIGQWGGHPYFQHGGSNEGFQCNAMAFLDGSRQGVVVMTNGAFGGLLAAEIIRALAIPYGWGEQDPGNKGSNRRAPYVPPAPKPPTS